MATNVNRVPYNLMPEEWAFDPKIGPFMRAFMDVAWQTRNRTGGDQDAIQTSQAQLEAEDSRKLPELRQLTKKVNQLSDQVATIQAQQREIKALKRRISELEAAINPKTELHKLRRRIESLEMQVN